MSGFRVARGRASRSDGTFWSICDRYPLGGPVERDPPISQNVSANQARVVRFLYKIGRQDANGVNWAKDGTREADSSSIPPTEMWST